MVGSHIAAFLVGLCNAGIRRQYEVLVGHGLANVNAVGSVGKQCFSLIQAYLQQCSLFGRQISLLVIKLILQGRNIAGRRAKSQRAIINQLFGLDIQIGIVADVF